MENVLKRHKVDYSTGKTWTIDAFYRETKLRRDLRKGEGCITVEMECAALMAVAQFRGVKFGHLLASGDDISGENWDFRHSNQIPVHNEKLLWLAAEACLEL